ncbi:hypothetical protein [Klebsiella pneumoniae]|uniref:hypothetical protein n=1 Tax=Klebsiella pneumoniae TaxID=573 RepID=UPI001F452B7D|nr:hypothetical protein [Klebsiella pneumoniae]MCE7441913.1 hypothetical protein [Klebsiella pneumoniae]MCE7451989.1 hypothetical protein [Klebsiella pneumoniae]
MKTPIIITLALLCSFNCLSADSFSSNAKLESYASQLQQTYLDIYNLRKNEKIKYEKLRLKVIDLNYNYLYEMKKENEHNFNAFNKALISNERLFSDCSKSIDQKFCALKRTIYSQNVLIASMVSKGISLEDTYNILNKYKENNYKSFIKLSH